MQQDPTIDVSIAEATTLSSVAGLIEQALRTYGVDPDRPFGLAGIKPEAIRDPLARIPTTRMQALWRRSLEATGDEGFGLTVAEQFQPAALHGLGFSWLASDTLRDAFHRLARFSRFITPFLLVHVEETERTVDLIMTGPERWPDFVHAAADAGMAVFLRMCRITSGETLLPEEVNLRRPAPSCVDRFVAFFGARVTFGSPTNRLCFASESVNRPLNTGNAELARINDQTVIDYLARFDRNNMAMQVRSRIIDRLMDGTPTQEVIADALHLSLRSLQRRLKEEETTFKELLEQTRRELAMQYIRDSSRPMGEISYLLGFSEPSNFTRAFRRWAGCSPAEFRERQDRK